MQIALIKSCYAFKFEMSFISSSQVILVTLKDILYYNLHLFYFFMKKIVLLVQIWIQMLKTAHR